MKKNRRGRPEATAAQSPEKPATLRDMLDAETLSKLKAASQAMQEEEARERERKRVEAEKARLAEQKRLENDFAYLLDNSRQDWKNFK
ncbi:DUF3886 domain-containing protein [Cohnella sp. CFH 77786]|uniref:YqkE family protein n=1 Tax=Cohnella sp. CFH 77786 TaxID=2662265 RepID=UPI001C60A5E5|nr:YqkE family protein [Cohnella sp. CFH 77786]MBW5446273.1 DUF3886 domain-containing protein [Cohnella sp. CFH 77786]